MTGAGGRLRGRRGEKGVYFLFALSDTGSAFAESRSRLVSPEPGGEVNLLLGTHLPVNFGGRFS